MRKTFYLTSIILAALAISASAQQLSEQLGQNPDTKAIEIEKISDLIPIKKGTALKKISKEDRAAKTVTAGDTQRSRQITGYVRPSRKERFNRYVNRSIGTGMIGVGASSIVQQISETPPEWEQNTKGFFRRLGSNLGKNVISESISYSLEESLKLDSKFYKSEKKDFGSRFKNAILSSFTARTPSGKRVFNPSRIAGRYAADIIATETWYPERYTYKDGVRQATRGIGFNIGFNFLREFVFPD